MHELGGIITEVGGFEVKTLAKKPSSGLLSDCMLSEEMVWWWTLRRKVFEAAAPDTAFGTGVLWHIVSQMCSPNQQQ
jgi:hypothetical protein